MTDTPGRGQDAELARRPEGDRLLSLSRWALIGASELEGFFGNTPYGVALTVLGIASAWVTVTVRIGWPHQVGSLEFGLMIGFSAAMLVLGFLAVLRIDVPKASGASEAAADANGPMPGQLPVPADPAPGLAAGSPTVTAD